MELVQCFNFAELLLSSNTIAQPLRAYQNPHLQISLNPDTRCSEGQALSQIIWPIISEPTATITHHDAWMMGSHVTIIHWVPTNHNGYLSL